MFSFRRDKTGFFVTIILLTIVGGTVISTLVLLIVGIAQGEWKSHLLSVRWILGSAWVACIITVLVRLKIFKWQMKAAQRRREALGESTKPRKETSAMGLTVLQIEVGNPATPEVTEKVDFLIDSGAIYSVVPRPLLEKLGLKPLTQEEFRLADGSRIARQKGIALFKYGERIGGADVIFGEEGDSTLLGALTLEALGLSLDPLRRELKPLPMILASL